MFDVLIDLPPFEVLSSEEHLLELAVKVCDDSLNFQVHVPSALKDVVFVIVVSTDAMLETVPPGTFIEQEEACAIRRICLKTKTIESSVLKVALIPEGSIFRVVVFTETMWNVV